MKESKIQIALCITELEAGGAEKALTELAIGLDRTRFSPIVYSLRAEDYHQKASFIPKIRAAGIPLRFLDVRTVRDLASAFFRLRRELKERKIDVLQAFLFHANLLGRFAGRAAGVPVVCSGIRVAERGEKWRLLVDRLTQRRVDRFVCVGRSVAEFTRTVGKIDPRKIVSIPNGVAIFENVPNFDDVPISGLNFNLRRDYSASTSELEPLFRKGGSVRNVVFLGRLTRQKGLDWLLETTPFWLKKDFAASPTVLWLIGDGEERIPLENQARSLGTLDRIRFPGWRPDVASILQNADLFVLPSRWEGMPNALLEAAANALPVLATNAEGVREILGDELVRDQTVDFGETELFCQKIQNLLQNDSRRRELGTQNQRRARELFSVEATIRRYENLWLELLNEKRR